MSLEIVDLPQPEAPTNATLEPGLRLIEKFSIRGSARREYPKVTFLSSTLPESLSYPAFSSKVSSNSTSHGYSITSSTLSISVRISCNVCPAEIREFAGPVKEVKKP